ncbi:hypothetical protein QIS74_07379 [Colletotrichum tabaci]|uniref:Uncharacterized protein n=1 Tax=Colletotrichum tabaci TaxID=1209068 RepID=A0AAV9TB46_9PEZI
MRFSLIAVLTLAAATQDVFAAHCRITDVAEDCCWGGNHGWDACRRQRKMRGMCRPSRMGSNYCRNVYREGPDGTQISISETCDADCCSTLTGEGIGCPK